MRKKVSESLKFSQHFDNFLVLDSRFRSIWIFTHAICTATTPSSSVRKILAQFAAKYCRHSFHSKITKANIIWRINPRRNLKSSFATSANKAFDSNRISSITSTTFTSDRNMCVRFVSEDSTRNTRCRIMFDRCTRLKRLSNAHTKVARRVLLGRKTY